MPDSEADELSTLFNIREHVRAQAWCLWRAGPGADTDAGFEALFDAKRHKRGVKSERWAAASVLDAAGEKDGGLLGDLFEEKGGIIAPKDEMSQPRGCQMVYVTVLSDPGDEVQERRSIKREQPESLCEILIWWVFGRRWS